MAGDTFTTFATKKSQGPKQRTKKSNTNCKITALHVQLRRPNIFPFLTTFASGVLCHCIRTFLGLFVFCFFMFSNADTAEKNLIVLIASHFKKGGTGGADLHSGRDVTLRTKWKDGDVETVSSGTSTMAHHCAASLPCARPDEAGG